MHKPKNSNNKNLALAIIKAPLLFVKYFLFGVYFTIYAIIYGIVKLFIYLSYVVYRIWYCFFYGIYFIIYYLLVGIDKFFKILITDKPKKEKKKKIEHVNLKTEKKKLEQLRKIRINEQKRLIKKNNKELLIQKKYEKRKSRSDKQKEIQELSKVTNTKDNYLNKNVKLEKKSLSKVLKEIGSSIRKIPKNIKSLFKNNVFAKDRRNKKSIKKEALLINFEGEDAEKSDVKQLYKYVAKDKNGKVIKGYFEAYSKVEVHSFLLSEGYEVYSIKHNKWIAFFHGKSTVNNVRIKTKDLIFFITQLSTYLKAGITLVEALKILSRQFKNKKYQKIFKAIIYDLTMGENFSDALLKQNVAFPRLFINMVKTAEMTGELPEVLDDMYNYYTESEQTRKQMITAMTYPSIVFVFAVGVITFIMIYVIPQFVEIYESMDASKIPTFTKMVISVSEFLQNNIGWLFLGILIFIALFYFLYKKVRIFRTVVQWIIMHIPVIGNTVIYNEVTMFTKTFSSLLAHNVFITDSMEILNKITNNEIYKMLILDTITNLAKGEKISTAFKDHWAFPIPAYEMLVTGEKTGELSEMMSKVSTYYQELHKNQVTRLKTFIEPILTVFLTVVTGIIILAIVLPMFGMYETIQSY